MSSPAPAYGGLSAVSSGEVAWDSLSRQQGWAGSQARQLHLLPQKSPPVQPPQPKVARNPCSELAPCKAMGSIKSHAPQEEPSLYQDCFLKTPCVKQTSPIVWGGCFQDVDLVRQDSWGGKGLSTGADGQGPAPRCLHSAGLISGSLCLVPEPFTVL